MAPVLTRPQVTVLSKYSRRAEERAKPHKTCPLTYDNGNYDQTDHPHDNHHLERRRGGERASQYRQLCAAADRGDTTARDSVTLLENIRPS